MGAALVVGLLDPIDLGHDEIGVLPVDASSEQFGDAGLDDRRRAAELFPDDFGLLDEASQHAVFRPLRVDEIAAIDARRRLEFAVDAAIALFKATRVPGQVEMEEVAAMPLKVQAFARGIGRDQDAERVVGGRGVECPFDILPAVGQSRTAENCDPILSALCMRDGLAQQALKPAPCVRVFGKDQHTAFCPDARTLPKARHHFALNPVDQMPDPRIRVGAIGPRRISSTASSSTWI